MHQGAGTRRIHIATLGCKLNQAESEALARNFLSAGCALADAADADVIILNTCTVTHVADRKARHLVRMLAKINPRARIVATGCFAERAKGELMDSGVAEIVGNRDKLSIPELVYPQMRERSAGTWLPPLPDSHIRSFIKIQDGCRHFCAYCIVPFVRADLYCAGSDLVVNEVKLRQREGYQEVVLTGNEIGSYQDGGTNLQELIKRLLQETAIARIHLSSLQPQDINDGLLELWQDTRLIRHFHLALQSGSDATLKRMKRKFDTSLFSRAVEAIRRAVPATAVTTDVMVGFPGETEQEFEESYRFCQNMQFAAMHVFNYSPRPGTAAARFQGKVNAVIKKQRSLRMLELAAKASDVFARGFIGQTRSVLWENETKPGSHVFVGLTDNYLRTYVRTSEGLSNQIRATRLVGLAAEAEGKQLRMSTSGNHGELWGRLVP